MKGLPSGTFEALRRTRTISTTYFDIYTGNEIPWVVLYKYTKHPLSSYVLPRGIPRFLRHFGNLDPRAYQGPEIHKPLVLGSQAIQEPYKKRFEYRVVEPWLYITRPMSS